MLNPVDTQGNMDVQVGLGAGFWIFLAILLIVIVLAYSGKLHKIAENATDTAMEEVARFTH